MKRKLFKFSGVHINIISFDTRRHNLDHLAPWVGNGLASMVKLTA